MTHHKKFKNESQDARRHDQQREVHPDEKLRPNKDNSVQNGDKHSHSPSDKRR